jgi:type IV pilus assembly protein PilO
MDKIFDKLPYDLLEDIKMVQFFLIAVGISLAVGAIYFFTLYDTTHTEIASLEKKKTGLERTLKANQELVAKKEFIANQLARTVGDLHAIKQQLPKEKEMPGLLKRVSGLAKTLGLDILLFQLQEGEIKDFYKNIPVNIEFRGGLWKAMDFFDGMQNLLRLVNFTDLFMDVRDVDILNSRGEVIRTVPMLHTKFIGETFSYIQGAEDKAAEAKPAK